jgi:hypothetical protein
LKRRPSNTTTEKTGNCFNDTKKDVKDGTNAPGSIARERFEKPAARRNHSEDVMGGYRLVVQGTGRPKLRGRLARRPAG